MVRHLFIITLWWADSSDSWQYKTKCTRQSWQPLKLRFFFFFFLVQLPNELFLFRARMGNIRGWGGPLPPSWYKIQLDLQRKILTAMRNLGMAPVLPGFAGFVPDGLKRVYPQAKLSRVSRWGGFNNTYCCTYHLHSTDPLFKVLVSYSAIRALPVKNSCWG